MGSLHNKMNCSDEQISAFMNLLGYLDYLRLKSEYKKCTLSTGRKFTICHTGKNRIGGLWCYERECRTK